MTTPRPHGNKANPDKSRSEAPSTGNEGARRVGKLNLTGIEVYLKKTFGSWVWRRFGKSKIVKTAEPKTYANVRGKLFSWKQGDPPPVTPEILPHTLKKYNLLPHAILHVPVRKLARDTNAKIFKGEDSLDSYIGAAFSIASLDFVVMHYKGYPRNVSTIFLPDTFKKMDEITRCISQIVAAFRLPDSALTWQRKDNPDL